MTKQRAYLNHDPAIRHAIAAVATAARRAEDTLTAAHTHQLTDVEHADLTDAITRLTRLTGKP
ncbi:hypothetical protein U2F26_03280 [Micromonospora sp. 4G57]|uniref:MarR family transcriptional regulator n=1 Tax=Micromonospora sicca TaxID=2202420 RepID=A0ABU5JCK1_9ACTN|nr:MULTISPECIES: hypothetical protein [unclassified Micromonospora]MDZ5441754.1 hypothetical protein [Micromonospora sp. 4G57]MDZ5490315.1 hypothetical protein [Micromonospora sp. 4G53]